MKKITLDTNILPATDLIEASKSIKVEFAIISVTKREVEGTSFEVSLEEFKNVTETAVWNESLWGQALWGGTISESFVLNESRLGEGILTKKQHVNVLETILKIISSGSFPKPSNRNKLTDNQRNQLRDAMILETHIREGRDILVSNDKRAYVNHGKRAALEVKFNIKIMTKTEFLKYCEEIKRV